MLRIADPLTAPVVNQYDVHGMSRRAGLAEVTRIGCGRLTGSCTAEHTLEDCQTIVIRDDLLQSDGGDVQFGTRGGHVGITLVGAYHNVACLCDTEVTTRHTSISRQELVSQTQTGYIRQIGGIVVAFLTTQFLLKQFTHIVVVQVRYLSGSEVAYGKKLMVSCNRYECAADKR